jgi:predicted hydrocarbon binding protein
MNYSKADLFESEAVMNQMRNAVYHLARFMEKNGRKNVIERLREMGKNIARTSYNYWRPINIITTSNIKDVLTTIYRKILISSVMVEVSDSTIIVKDNSCPLCKYEYDDISIAGCEIIMGMISELITLISKESKHMSSIYLEPLNVEKSKAFGHNSCIHVYRIKSGGA